jgi:hypothetical protein
VSESSPSHLAWPMHPGITPTHLEAASRSEILDRDRPQAYIIDSGRKPAALSHINARDRKLRTPHINNPGRKPSGARTGAQEAASGGGVG